MLVVLAVDKVPGTLAGWGSCEVTLWGAAGITGYHRQRREPVVGHHKCQKVKRTNSQMKCEVVGRFSAARGDQIWLADAVSQEKRRRVAWRGVAVGKLRLAIINLNSHTAIRFSYYRACLQGVSRHSMNSNRTGR
jgi:hypothetical protein